MAQSILAGKEGAQHAMSLSVAEKYVDAFGKLAKEGTAVVVPGNVGDMGSMIASGMAMYGKVNEAQATALARKSIQSGEDNAEYDGGKYESPEARKKAMKDTVIAGFNQTAGNR